MAVAKTSTRPSERRVAVRRQPTVGTVLNLTSGTKGKPRVGLVWNLSSSGVSLLMHDALKPGTTVLGELTTLNGEVTLPVTIRVAHLSTLRTGDYCVGGQFDEALSAAEIRPFLSRG